MKPDMLLRIKSESESGIITPRFQTMNLSGKVILTEELSSEFSLINDVLKLFDKRSVLTVQPAQTPAPFMIQSHANMLNN